MTIGKRPGGLTALGIIHLVFGALGILGLIMLAGMFALLNSGVLDDALEEASEQAAVEAAEEAGVEAAEGGESPAPGEEPAEAEPETPPGDVVPEEATEEIPPAREEPPEVQEFREMFEGSGRTALLLGLAISLLATVLQILSAIGYLGQKRVLGRYIGNLYGIISLAGVGISLAIPQPGASQWMVLTNMVLPVITLVLINTTFKDDLVR